MSASLPADAWAAARFPEVAPLPRIAPTRRFDPTLAAIHAKPWGTLTADDWRVLEQAEAASLPLTQSKDVA